MAPPVITVERDTARWQYVVRVNGRKLRRADVDGIRPKFISPSNGIIIKVDSKGGQCAQERRLWEVLDAEDRRHFVPIVAFGLSRCGNYEWIAQPLMPSGTRTPAYGTSAYKKARALFEKYALLRDWSPEQFKVTPSGRLLVHDYGFSASPLVAAA